ncbi:MAG: OmpH family outer membrane protein [Saprospiraceae bacterium]|nr:OmpH family outer membrane protein [Saprospiraceae bacterium]
MNQVFRCLTTTAIILASIVTISAQKIGYVNRGSLLAEIPAVKQANNNLEALQKQLQKKAEGMITEFRGKYEDLQRKEQQGELSPKQLEDEGQKLREEEVKIQQYQQEMQNQLAEKQESLLLPILEDLNAKIAEVAKESGYGYIIDDTAGILLYKEEGHDVTAMVKKKLGLD